MIETSGVIEKEQGNGFYLVTLEQPAGHQCLCRAAGKLTKFESSCSLATRCWWRSALTTSPVAGSPTGNATLALPVVVQVETVPVALAVVEPQRSTSRDWIESLNSLRCLTPRHCCFSSLS